MNAERPAYEQREFYGPLQLAEGVPEIRYRYMLEHPHDSSRLIRTTDEGLYIDREDMEETVRVTQYILRSLKNLGINHVNPSYINETGEDGEPFLLIVVDKLKNFEPYSELIRHDSLSEEQIHEVDLAISHMFDFIVLAMKENGYIDIEMMHLEQFVYDSSQQAGQKMVLVDVEPAGSRKVEMDKDSMEYGYPSPLCGGAAKLIVDTIELANKSEYYLQSFQKATEVIRLLPGDSEKTNQMKKDLLNALTTRTLSRELMYYADVGIIDNKDDSFSY